MSDFFFCESCKLEVWLATPTSDITEIGITFDDNIHLNAAWGRYPPQNIIIIYKSGEKVYEQRGQDIEFRPDVQYLHDKTKLLLAFS